MKKIRTFAILTLSTILLVAAGPNKQYLRIREAIGSANGEEVELVLRKALAEFQPIILDRNPDNYPKYAGAILFFHSLKGEFPHIEEHLNNIADADSSEVSLVAWNILAPKKKQYSSPDAECHKIIKKMFR